MSHIDFTPGLAQLKRIEDHAIAIAKRAAKAPTEAKPKAAEPKLTAKGRRIVELTKAHFADGHAKAIGKLMAVVLDEPEIEAALARVTSGGELQPMAEIPGYFEKNEWVKGAAVVPLKNDNGHNYVLGQVAIMSDSDHRGWRLVDGKFVAGNHLGSRTGGSRPATVAEIKAAFAEMRKALKALNEKKKEIPFLP